MTNEEQRQYKKDTYDTYKRLHLCVGCHKQDARTLNGYVYCFECGETKNARKREYYKTDVGKRYMKDYYLRIRKQRTENKECLRCGQPLKTTYTFKNCPKCRAKNAQRLAKHRAKKGITPRVLFDGVDRCCMCGKLEVVDGHKVCKQCLERQQKLVFTAREAKRKTNNMTVEV